MDAMAKTYRYLDETEIAARQPKAQPKPHLERMNR